MVKPSPPRAADLLCIIMTPMSRGSTARLAARSRQYERNFARSFREGIRGATGLSAVLPPLLGRLTDPRETASPTITSALHGREDQVSIEEVLHDEQLPDGRPRRTAIIQ